MFRGELVRYGRRVEMSLCKELKDQYKIVESYNFCIWFGSTVLVPFGNTTFSRVTLPFTPFVKIVFHYCRTS